MNVIKLLEEVGPEKNLNTSTPTPSPNRGLWISLLIVYLVLPRLLGIMTTERRFVDFTPSSYYSQLALVGIDFAIGLVIAFSLTRRNPNGLVLAKIGLALLLGVNLLLLLFAAVYGKVGDFLISDRILDFGAFNLGTIIARSILLGQVLVFDPSILQTAWIFLFWGGWFLYLQLSKRVQSAYSTCG